MDSYRTPPLAVKTEATEWAITPVCDIRLGELFRSNSELAGKYLDIDIEAIRDTLHEISPDSHGTLAFRASHDYDLNHEGATTPTRYGVTKRIPNIIQRLSFGKFDDSIRVNVTIGGSYQSFPENLTDYFTTYIQQGKYANRGEATQALLSNRKLRHKLLRQKDPALDVAAMARIMGSTKDEMTIHKTVVHELTHAADSPQLMKDDTKAVKKYYRKHIAPPIYATAASVTGVAYGMEKLADAPDALTYCTQAVMWATTFYAMRGKRAAFREFTRAGRPTEVRAYAMEKRAIDFPKVITFKNQ